jgi:hypothetical protein
MARSIIVGRQRSRARRIVLSVTTALSSGLAMPAWSQTIQPPYQNVDPNGVDLTDGSFTFDILEGSIGAGEARLEMHSLQRNLDTTDTVDNWTTLRAQATGSGSARTVYINIGLTSDRFVGGATTSAIRCADWTF